MCLWKAELVAFSSLTVQASHCPEHGWEVARGRAMPRRLAASRRHGTRAQDPQLEVRAAFGARVRRAVTALLPWAAQRCAKVAALLPLAAADPSMDHRAAAHHALSEYVALRRRAAAAAAASPLAASGTGGTMLHELPEYMLPFLLQARAGPALCCCHCSPGRTAGVAL